MWEKYTVEKKPLQNYKNGSYLIWVGNNQGSLIWEVVVDIRYDLYSYVGFSSSRWTNNLKGQNKQVKLCVA